MRYGTTPMAAIETIMTNCAISEIGKYFGLPTHAYLGLSDSKVFDQQAGLESSMGLLLGSIAGVNVISGPGMLEFEKCQSMEKLVMDNELCGMCLRLIDGITVSQDALAIDLQKEIGHEGHFLSSKHTLKWFRKEQHIPSKLIDRQPRKMWKKNGSKDGTTKTKEQVEKILAQSNPKPLEKSLKRNLDEVVIRFAKANNVISLPLGPQIDKS
jgi:trimethylamine--corrinoid protein Co-methyltransferase